MLTVGSESNIVGGCVDDLREVRLDGVPAYGNDPDGRLTPCDDGSRQFLSTNTPSLLNPSQKKDSKAFFLKVTKLVISIIYTDIVSYPLLSRPLFKISQYIISPNIQSAQNSANLVKLLNKHMHSTSEVIIQYSQSPSSCSLFAVCTCIHICFFRYPSL